jgi:hypothetical protein
MLTALPLAATTAAVLVAEPVETWEVTFTCGPVMMRLNPATWAIPLDAGVFQRLPGHAVIDHFIYVALPGGDKMRIDRDTNKYDMWSWDGKPMRGGTCRITDGSE